MANKTISEKILYTLTGCPACIELKDELKDKIKNGQVKVKECNFNSKNPKVLEICKEAMDKEDFDGFPSVYLNNGTKEY